MEDIARLAPARIVILGAGVVGRNAAQIAVGSGAQVVVIDKSVDALRSLDAMLGSRVMTVFSNRDNVEREVLRADLVISGVLVPGAAAPKLVSREMVGRMKQGAVIVDPADIRSILATDASKNARISAICSKSRDRFRTVIAGIPVIPVQARAVFEDASSACGDLKKNPQEGLHNIRIL